MKDVILNISKDFSFGYGTNILFRSKINISFGKGKIYGIFGSNGTGKTSLLNILNTFLLPNTGMIEYTFKNGNHSFGRNTIEQKLNIISNNIRRCFQTPLLVDELSVLDNIIVGKRDYNNERFINSLFHNSNFNYDDIIKLLKQLNIEPDNSTEKLSYGQRRIVANLQILFTSPQLILLDEPFAGLHSDVIELFKKIYKEKTLSGATIIIVEHLSKNLTGFADDFLLIKDKKLELIDNVGTN